MKLSIIRLPNAVIRVVELALDGGVSVFFPQTGDQVDTDIATIPAVDLSPIGIGLHILVLLPLHRIVGEESYREALEIGAFLAFGACGFAVRIQEVVECIYRH